jgi:hypothetical protein
MSNSFRNSGIWLHGFGQKTFARASVGGERPLKATGISAHGVSRNLKQSRLGGASDSP